MKVLLAGYNLDHDLIREIETMHPELQTLTPETISAAYARISRSPLAVDELRRAARQEVEKARQSNRNIVFDMGHSSIAEHAVFNIDLLGVSRLVVEEIERARLCSFTEKSQRYVLFQDDFVVPLELKGTACEDRFTATVREQYALYHELYEKLRDYVFETHAKLARDPAKQGLLEGWAKEDARYIIAQATETQLGMTLNARNLELMLKRLAASSLEEARELGRRLHEVAVEVTPSLIRYATPTAFDLETRPLLANLAAQSIAEWGKKKWDDKPRAIAKKGNVVLYDATPEADDRLIATLLFTSSGHPMEKCLNVAALMDPAEKEALIRGSFHAITAHDAPMREFEASELCFELTVSASCFAQLKRHRIATIHVQPYYPALGVTIPPAVAAVNMTGRFREVIARTEETYEQIKQVAPEAAPYILTNAHRRRVSLKINAREMYHIARLRADAHAQWDIRETTDRMLALARRIMPLTMMLATGKDAFSPLYEQHFPKDGTTAP